MNKNYLEDHLRKAAIERIANISKVVSNAPKAMTPGQAIRKFCIQCVGGANEVKNCGGDKLLTGEVCNFFKYRLGRGRPSVKTIRKECNCCTSNSYTEIAGCASSDSCPVHAFRMGTNPNFVPKDRDRHPFSV